MKNKTILFYLLTLLISVSACIPYISIYTLIPRWSKLSKELVRNAIQIYPYEEGLILVSNLSPHRFDSDYYLLFFDRSSQLEAGCYLSDRGIHGFSNNTISSYKAPIYDEEKEYRTNNLPKNIKLNMLDCGFGGASTRNKVITNLEVIELDSSNSLQLKIKFHQGEHIAFSKMGDISPLDSNANTSEVLLDLRNIYFDYNSIYTATCSPDKKGIRYTYYVFLPGEQDKLYAKIYKHLKVSL